MGQTLGCFGYGLIAFSLAMLALVSGGTNPQKGEQQLAVGMILVFGIILVVARRFVSRKEAAEQARLQQKEREIEARLRAEQERFLRPEPREEAEMTTETTSPRTSKTFKCTHCGAVSRAPAGSGVASCDYCGSAVALE